MLRRMVYDVMQTRGLKDKVKVNWVKPPYVPAYKPERSGDLEALPPIPETSLSQIHSLSDEIKDAPESVKKIFSVAHMGRKEFNNLVREDTVDRVRRHKYDDGTPETKIAKITAQIRWLQYTLEKFPRNVKAKQTAQELIDKRKKLLKFMRQSDYKKFEWLLEKLEIEYKAHPDSFHKLSRKESIRKLTEMHCEEICNNKLADFRTLLESQQGPFLREKLSALKFIKSEQIDLQLQVTVTDQDIKKVEKQLEEWTAKDLAKQQAKKKKRDLAIDLD